MAGKVCVLLAKARATARDRPHAFPRARSIRLEHGAAPEPHVLRDERSPAQSLHRQQPRLRKTTTCSNLLCQAPASMDSPPLGGGEAPLKHASLNDPAAPVRVVFEESSERNCVVGVFAGDSSRRRTIAAFRKSNDPATLTAAPCASGSNCIPATAVTSSAMSKRG